MSGLEPIILTIASVSSMILSTSIMGKSLQEIAPNAFGTGMYLIKWIRKSYAMVKLTKCLFFSVYIRIPRKSDIEFKSFGVIIKEIYKRYTAKETYQFYRYVKELSPLAVECNLYNDEVFMKNKYKILVNPEYYKSYICKALYCKVLCNIIEVQLWTATPPSKDVKKLTYSFLYNIAKKEDVSVEQCRLMCENFEKKINKYQMSQKVKYEEDFESEKNIITNILSIMENDDDTFDEGGISSIVMINKAVKRQKNAIGFNNVNGISDNLNEVNKRIEASFNIKNGSIQELEREQLLITRSSTTNSNLSSKQSDFLNSLKGQ